VFVEYPVLTGVVIWASALLRTHRRRLPVAVRAPARTVRAVYRVDARPAQRLAFAGYGPSVPPLVLYAFHNWELPVVLCAVAAFYVVYRGLGQTWRDRPLLQRATVAAVLLGLGFTFKIYPAIFVLPLMLYVLTGGRDGREFAGRVVGRALDCGCFADRGGRARYGPIAVNLPFVLLGFDGWRASFAFQLERKADLTTNSIWYWALRPDSDPDNKPVQDLIGLLSPTSMMISFVVACAIGWMRYQKEGTYPCCRCRRPCCVASCCCTRCIRRSTRSG